MINKVYLRYSIGALALAVLSLSSCAKKTETTMTDSTGVTTQTTQPGGAVAQDTSHSTVAPPAQLTDANILAMLNEGDSSEVVEGQLVKTKSKNADVKGFAAMMITDHGKLMKDGEALAKKLNITPQPPANDPKPGTLTQLMSELNGASNPRAFDSLYMTNAVSDHEHDVQELKELQEKAQNADLKAAIGKAIPVVQKHLDKAKSIHSKLMSATTTP
jgi:putative membrane protein